MDTIAILKDLISIRSDVNAINDEAEIGAYLFDFLSALSGWEVKKQVVSATRFNLVASNAQQPRYVFVGHQDTVPVTDSQQLFPSEVEGKLFGRGAVDMKAGVALMLRLAETTQQKIGLIFTVGEEYDFVGMKALLKQYRCQPELVLNLEPTDLSVMTGCRGLAEFSVEITGQTAHAASGQGVSVLRQIGPLIDALESALQETDLPGLRTSVNLASVQGGVQRGTEIICQPNMIPNIARAVIEIRLGSRQTESALRQLFRTLAKERGLQVTNWETAFIFSPFASQGKAVDAFTKVVGERTGNTESVDINRTGYFEVQLLEEVWQCPVVIFGPGPKAKAHQDDEYVELSQLRQAEEVLTAFLKK